MGENHSRYAISLNYLAGLYEAQSNYKLAASLYEQANQVWLHQTQNNFSYLSEKERGLFLRNFQKNFDTYNSFIAKAVDSLPNLTGWAYNNILAIKGLQFQSTQKIQRSILSSGDSLFIKKFRNWQNKRNTLAQTYMLSSERKQKLHLDKEQLEKEINILEKELSLQSKVFITSASYTWQDVQKKLQTTEAAIEIIRTYYYNDENQKLSDSVIYLAVILKSNSLPEMVIMPQGKQLEKEYLSLYRNRVQFKKRDLESYKQYWQPIAKKLKGIKKVYFSADGVYHQINLATLFNPASQKYVFEEIDIRLLGSTKYLIEDFVKPPIKGSKAVLIGRPIYELELEHHQGASRNIQDEERGDKNNLYSISQEMTEIKWTDLPGTETETQTIHKLLKAKNWTSELYLGERALEDVIKKTKNPYVLHIATHGFFFKVPFQAKNPSYQSTTMLQSGLVLSGVTTYAKNRDKYNLNIDDGLLTAYEAQNLVLDSTELVILSACETGQGDIYHSEGVYGLQRAFQTAGARSVIMSLWKVDDKITQELMTQFYTLWLSNQDKRKAFNLAQQKIKTKYIHPYYWGAFILVGE